MTCGGTAVARLQMYGTWWEDRPPSGRACRGGREQPGVRVVPARECDVVDERELVGGRAVHGEGDVRGRGRDLVEHRIDRQPLAAHAHRDPAVAAERAGVEDEPGDEARVVA